MPSSARGVMFRLFGAFRRICNRVLRGDEGIVPYEWMTIGCQKFDGDSHTSVRAGSE